MPPAFPQSIWGGNFEVWRKFWSCKWKQNKVLTHFTSLSWGGEPFGTWNAWTTGDQMVQDSNQKLKMPYGKLDASQTGKFSFCIPALACPAAKVQRAGKVKSFPPLAPIQPFGITCIWYWSHNCQQPKPAQILMANISTYLAPLPPQLSPSGPINAEPDHSPLSQKGIIISWQECPLH